MNNQAKNEQSGSQANLSAQNAADINDLPLHEEQEAEIRGGDSGNDKRQDYLKIELKEVMVSSWSTSA